MFKNVIRNWFLSSVLHLTRLALFAVFDVLESKEKKVLAATNKAKVNLSDLPHPTLKIFYLGMTFPPPPQNRLTCHVAFLKPSH